MVVELMQKRVELPSELVPQTRVIALLVNPNDPNAEHFIEDAQKAARGVVLQLDVLKASNENEIDAAFATLVQLHAASWRTGCRVLPREDRVVGIALCGSSDLFAA